MTVAATSTFQEHLDCLPPLPVTVQRVLEVTGTQNSTAEELAHVLAEDQAVAARVLRIANSPFYGATRGVSQISRAVVLLGTVGVRNLVISICARDAIPVPEEARVEHAQLWRHAAASAAAADLIARQVGYRPVEEAFVGGLLHDIGHLAMVAYEPQAFRQVLEDESDETHFLERERAAFGINHAEAGERVLSRWRLPHRLATAARHHHDPCIVGGHPHARLMATVVLADVLAHIIGEGFDFPVARSGRGYQALEVLNLSESDQLQIIGRLGRRTQETLELLSAGDGTPAPPTEPGPARRAVWITNHPQRPREISEMLLEYEGYHVVRATPESALIDGESNDPIFIAPDVEDGRVVSQLLNGQRRRIVVLGDESHHRWRRRDPATGICYLPPLLTAYDIAWLEDQWLK